MATELRRILLLGAGGQVGRELVGTLASAGELFAYTRRELDLCDADAIHRAIDATRPALLVNAAAYTNVDGAEDDTARAYAVNQTAPGVLAKAARERGAAFVHYSTDYVFDGSGDRPWTEDDPTRPVNAYGRSKLAGELAVRETGAAHLIVRTAWVYGVGGNNFVETMLRLGATRQQLKVVADQFGAPTSARTIAQVTRGLLDACAEDWANGFRSAAGLLHVTCRGSTSWHGFAEEIFRLARLGGIELEVREVEAIASSDFPTPARRPQNSRLDCRRLTERFGIEPPDWQSALARYFEDRSR